MEEFKHKDTCNYNHTVIEISGIYQMEYCSECGMYDISDLPCEHNFIYVRSILSDKRIQLRNFCTKCSISPSKAVKQDGVDMDKIPIRTHVEISDHNDKIRRESMDGFSILISKLKQKQHEANKDWYAEYLNSPEWFARSEATKKRYNYTCQMCGKKATDAHHLSYDYVKREYEFDLVALCHQCHEDYHKNKNKN